METAIQEGRVKVDGAVVRELGVQVDPERQRVDLDGKRVQLAAEQARVLALHKPPRVLATTDDPHGRPTVLDLVPATLRGSERLYPVGRLDFESEGLVLLTNDGDLAHRLMHPRFGHERAYRVEFQGAPPADLAERFAAGLDIGDARPAFATITRVTVSGDGGTAWLGLTEGRNRQLRRMFDAVGLRVTRLIRERIGRLVLGDLPAGKARELGSDEIAALTATLPEGYRPSIFVGVRETPADNATRARPARSKEVGRRRPTPRPPTASVERRSGTTQPRRNPRPPSPRDRSSGSRTPRGG